MKTLRTRLTPPGGFRFTHPETGHVTKASSYEQLVDQERAYRIANHLPIGSEFEQEIVNSLCEAMLQAGWLDGCMDTEPPTLAQRVASLAVAAAHWTASGFKVVSADEYLSRLATCKSCDLWRGEAMLGFGKCARCGCAGLKLFAATENCPKHKWAALRP